MKDELKGKIMTRFDALRPKTLCYLTDLQTNKQTKKILLPPTSPVPQVAESNPFCLLPHLNSTSPRLKA